MGMKKLLDYIEKYGNFSQYELFYDIEKCDNYWEAHGTVIFFNKLYQETVYSNSLPLILPNEELIKKLLNKIIHEYSQSESFWSSIHLYNNNNFQILNYGDKINFLENSLEALYSACENKDGFKTDIRLTNDNIWIVYQDEDCNRLHNLNIKIKDYSYNFLKKNINVITLEDLLFSNNFKNKLINIEIKQDSNINIIAKLNLITILS